MYRIENTSDADIVLPNGTTVRAGRAVGVKDAAWVGMSEGPIVKPRLDLGHLTAKKIKEPPVEEAADAKPPAKGS